MSRAHPRIGGEYNRNTFDSANSIGSPPHRRGIHPHGHDATHPPRLTPA